jgi:hypothetical protein
MEGCTMVQILHGSATTTEAVRRARLRLMKLLETPLPGRRDIAGGNG